MYDQLDPNRRLSTRVLAATLALTSVGLASTAFAEGTAQLGAGQDVRETTVIKVDVLTAGEVIHIVAGNGTDQDVDQLILTVLDPDGVAIAGSPFTIGMGRDGYIIGHNRIPTLAELRDDGLEIPAMKVGTYELTFDNTGTFDPDYDAVIDPLDIAVMPDDQTPPSVEPEFYAGSGRVHSDKWVMNAHNFVESAAMNSSVYVLTPTGPDTDFTWELELNGLAGNTYDLTGNDVGLPDPHSGFSEDQGIAFQPEPLYEVYLNVPAVARGGDATPQVTDFEITGPSEVCRCAVSGLTSRLTFQSNVDAIYEVVIDIDGNAIFDPAAGDVLKRGQAITGENVVEWDGKDEAGNLVASGDYNARLSVRLGEFHFVGADIETSKPGLRMFGVEGGGGGPPDPLSPRSPAMMFWDDSRINSVLSERHRDRAGQTVPANQQCIPESTVATDGLSSGNKVDPAVCGGDDADNVNAHCWGNFQTRETNQPGVCHNEQDGGLPRCPPIDPESPGNHRYIDTYVFFTETVLTALACVLGGEGDEDMDGLTNAEECSGDFPSDPNDADTDSDGISDGDELGGDVMTDPNSPDTDNDGIPDGVEDKNQDGNLNADETNPTLADSDMDGLDDGVEDANRDGILDDGETDPIKADTDDDGLSDALELGFGPDGAPISGANKTDPNVADSDMDGLNDGDEDENANGIKDESESDPNLLDTDGDGLSDGTERGFERVDNGDGTFTVTMIEGHNPTSPVDADTDDDGLDDGLEDLNGNGIRDASESDPTLADTDSDGLTDAEEVNTHRTDPTKSDTDGGGESDGSEVNTTGHDPLDPSDDRADTLALFGGGCACNVAGNRDASTGQVWLLLGLTLLGFDRRRRSRRRRSRMHDDAVSGGGQS